MVLVRRPQERKHSQAGESRAGCPNLFLLKKSPQLNLPRSQRSRIDQTKRHGFRPSVRPSVVIVVNARSRRPKETDGQGQTEGRTTVLSCVAHQSRPSADTPPLPPHGPGNHGPTTHQPAPHFPLHYVGPPSYPAGPRPPRPAGPTTPRVSTLNRPKASLPCHNPDNKQTNKRTGTSVCPIPLAPSSQRWRQAPRDLLAPARSRVSERLSE